MKHPIITQARNDIKAARKIWLPWRVLLPWGVFCLAVELVLNHFGKLNMSLPLLGSIVVFAFFIYLKWELRREPPFWSVIAAFAALHALLIWYIPWTSRWVPAVVTTGVVSIDICLMLWVLAAVEVLLTDQATAEN